MYQFTDGDGEYAQVIPDDGYPRCDAPATPEQMAQRLDEQGQWRVGDGIVHSTVCGERAITALEPFALCYDHLALAGDMAEQWRRSGFLAADALDF